MEGDENPGCGRAGCWVLVLAGLLIVMTLFVSVPGGDVFRGQGVRQGGAIVMQALAQGKQAAAETKVVHFVAFSPPGQDGWMEIRRDIDGDGVCDDTDPPLGPKLDVPKNMVFEKAPMYVSFDPDGRMAIKASDPEIRAAAFDASMNSGLPCGDVILKVRDKPYRYCMDLDCGAGKIRRHYFDKAEE